MSDALVLPLAAIGRADLAQAGGKGANLGELVRAGFAVPDGFCLTTAAYLRRGTHAADVAAACLEAYRALGGGPVAVRSSATAEDLPAVVARELGLPAVVGVSGATMRIATGARVRLDGTAGTIELLEPRA